MQTWVKRGHVGVTWPTFGISGPPTLISRERLRLETSNMVWRWTSVRSNAKNAILGQKGSCGGHVTQFWNFGTPLISCKRLKLEISILAWRRTAVSSNDKMQYWVKRGHVGVTWPNFGISGPLNISRTVGARNFKFVTETDGGRKKCKIGSKGFMWGSRDPTFGIWVCP